MFGQPIRIHKNVNKKVIRKKTIKNWSQSASSIPETKQASQIRCRSSYSRALVVKFNE